MKKLLKALTVGVITALFILPASVFAQANSTDDLTTMLVKYGTLKAQYDDLLVKYGAERARADKAVSEASGLKAQVENLATQVGLLKSQLETEKENVAKLKKVFDSVGDDSTARAIWARTLESAYEKIAALEKEVSVLKGKMASGESKIVDSLVDAGVPPYYFLVFDCNEGDWDCEKSQKAERNYPSVNHYGDVVVQPMFSKVGEMSEETQAKLATKRAKQFVSELKSLGFRVTVASAIEGGSRVMLTFVSQAMPGYKVQQIENLVYKNAGVIKAIVERVKALERIVLNHEDRITTLEQGVKFQIGLLGSFSLIEGDMAAGAGLLDLSLHFPIVYNWVLVLVGQGGVGNGPGELTVAAPYHFGALTGFEFDFGRLLVGAKSVGLRGNANQSLAEGCMGELRTDINLVNLWLSDFRLTVEVGFGPIWRAGELSSVFQAAAGLGFGF